MGRVTTEVTIENLADLVAVRKGQMTADQVRRITVSDALVDTGATGFAMPTNLLKQLGLTKISEPPGSIDCGINPSQYFRVNSANDHGT